LRPFIELHFTRYVFVAALNTVLSYAIYCLLLWVTPYQVAYSISYIASIFTSYLMNTLWVFHSPLAWRKALAFPLVYLAQYLTGLILLGILVERFGVAKLIASPLTMVATVPLSFVLSRFVLTRGT